MLSIQKSLQKAVIVSNNLGTPLLEFLDLLNKHLMVDHYPQDRLFPKNNN